MRQREIALNGFELIREEKGVPEWVQLLPAGDVVGRDGRRWKNNNPAGVLLHFGSLGRDLPVDIEHSSEHKAPQGDPAPAVGWINEVQERAGEIWGRIEWNQAGVDVVEARAYRYLSPVIVYTKDSRSIVGITSVGLTNQPNLQLPALNNQQGETPKEDQSMWSLVSEALGLPETATEQDAAAKIKELKKALNTAKMRAQHPDLARFVPRADYDAAVEKASNACQQLADVQNQQQEEAITRAIDKALKEGRITPATREYHIAQCRSEGGLERFNEFCRTAPVIAGDSELEGKSPEKNDKALNAVEREVLKNLDISEEAYRQANVSVM